MGGCQFTAVGGWVPVHCCWWVGASSLPFVTFFRRCRNFTIATWRSWAFRFLHGVAVSRQCRRLVQNLPKQGTFANIRNPQGLNNPYGFLLTTIFAWKMFWSGLGFSPTQNNKVYFEVCPKSTVLNERAHSMQ